MMLRLLFIVAPLLALMGCHDNGMLNPKGIITLEERKLFFDTLALMLIVVLPVIVMSLTFVYHYKASHRIRDYKPDWSHDHLLESLWWGIPCVIIVILAAVTWIKTHQLDPYQRIKKNESPLLIQVIALPWKWLFIYPDQQIATVNDIAIPVGRQVEYWMTTDNVPMSALFIPQLASQVYVMSGMRTRLHLIADEAGDYLGMNTLFNGAGFAEMQFTTHALSDQALQSWFNQIKKTAPPLTDSMYTQLLHSSINEKPAFFSGIPTNLFQNVLNTYINSIGYDHPREQTAKFDDMV